MAPQRGMQQKNNMRHAAKEQQHLARQRASATKPKKVEFSTRRRRWRQTLYNQIGAECAECTRACDEYFGHNGRVVDSSTGTSGRTEGTHLGFRRTERFSLQYHK